MTIELDPFVVAVIAAMGVATYVTKAGGLWLLGKVDLSPRVEAGLEILPGAIIVSILAPELVGGTLATWLAAAAVLVVAWRTDSIMISLGTGVIAILALRAVL
ncbi:MAG: AzlD domain-containing protein [Halohasta sp.]